MSYRISWSLLAVFTIISYKANCQSSCPGNSVVESWSSWVCNLTALTSYRTGTCSNSSTTVVETHQGPVVSWTQWSFWSPPCGLNKQQERSRQCVVPEPGTPYCSTCVYQNNTETASRDADIPSCCGDLPYGPWSPWSPGCREFPEDTVNISQSHGRSRECNSSRCLPCPLDLETRTAVIRSWGEWGEWSGSLRPCSEKVYRSRRRSCPAPTNPDGYPVYSCCNRTDVEYSCCGYVYSLRKLSCSAESCLYECYNATSIPPSDSPSPLTTVPLICQEDPPSCDRLGDLKNISIPHSPTAPTTQPVPVYVWPIIVLSVVSVVILLVVIVIVILCYKSYKKYKHSYQLMNRRKELEGVYGHIALGSSKATSVAPSSTKERREDQGDFWSNPLHSTVDAQGGVSYYGDDEELVDDDEELVDDDEKQSVGDGRLEFSEHDGGIHEDVDDDRDVSYDDENDEDGTVEHCNPDSDEDKDYHSDGDGNRVRKDWVTFEGQSSREQLPSDEEQDETFVI